MSQSEAADTAAPDPQQALPIAALAVRLLDSAPDEGDLLYVARAERRAGRMARILGEIAPDLEVLTFPAWDCVPYDRAGPSREVMGIRTATLRQLSGPAQGRRIVVTTPEALAQRVAPRSLWSGAEFHLKVGDELPIEAFEDFLLRTGYILDERVDEAGEAAIRGAVVDLFPPVGGHPVRLDHSDGRITGIRSYDPATQRTLADQVELTLLPVSEVVLPPTEEPPERFPAMEHWLPDFYAELETLFDYLPGAALVLDPGAADAYEQFWEQVEDAHKTRLSMPRGGGARPALTPDRLYLDAVEWGRRIAEMDAFEPPKDGLEPVPRFAAERDPARALSGFLADQLDRGRRIVLAARLRRELHRLSQRALAALEADPVPAGSWTEALSTAGRSVTLPADLDGGFVDSRAGVVAIGAADLFGSRVYAGAEEASARAELGMTEVELRPGDAVIHMDHGLALLSGIETIAPAGAAAEDALQLEFAEAAKLLVPAAEIEKVWRYGAEAESVSLDKLNGATWPKRRAELEQDLAATARKLIALAKERRNARGETIVPPRRAYERFASGFPYAETPDQARAIDEVLADLASDRPMNRLVCGDVGFGKTEVALRAAAAAVLAGKQVAVVAPTTVLVRQHVQSFRRRFAGFGQEVAHLSRLVKSAEARAVKQGLASGETRLVIGTHALAGKGIKFKDLGLLIIDEEQRFGAKQKEALRALGNNVDVLTLTATPIPRTLELALVGLQEVSIIATPPARRQPVRTFLTPFDAVTVRTALLRERARGGQSFVVCPRIEDMQPMADRLRELVPELQVMAAHGKMPAEEIDRVMVDFADGIGDVLLATNIIESGLDVPRANTILVWRADRFGLAQLHQLRGRVGRGRARGTAYLLTDPETEIAKATEQRLRTLEALDRLGAGFAISGRDLDLRGAGDLLGEEQAGHVKLIGVGLYQHMLQRAVATARGEVLDNDWSPALHVGLDTNVPEDYIPEPELRINLHARLARLGEGDEPGDLADEILDRFGPLPDTVQNLIAVCELRRRARRLGIEKLDAGPEAIAASFRAGTDLPGLSARTDIAEQGMEWRGERLVWPRPSSSPEERRKLARRFLAMLAGETVRRRVRPAEQPAVEAA
jgi:transcription-repair coupling factor (superfamily II helicase)